MGEKMVEERPVIWFWGHEHRWSIYDLNQINEGVKAYGRCIGHGGMPATMEGVNKPKFRKKAEETHLLFYDGKENLIVEDMPLTKNGYARLFFDRENLKIEHVMCENAVEYGVEGFAGKVVFTEQWTIDIETGILTQNPAIPSLDDVVGIMPNAFQDTK